MKNLFLFIICGILLFNCSGSEESGKRQSPSESAAVFEAMNLGDKEENEFDYIFAALGSKNTGEFVVRGNWRLHWNIRSNKFKIRLHNIAGDLLSEFNSNDSKIGEKKFDMPGKYFIEVETTGPWKIGIIDR